MPRSCLLGDPYKVVQRECDIAIVEVDSEKVVKDGYALYSSAKEDCDEMNNRAFIEEERYWQNKLDNENISSNNDED